MDIKRLEKATKIYEQIKLLDAEIIEIDRFAMLIANGEIKSSFELKVDDIGSKKEDENKVRFDSDGSIINTQQMQTMMYNSIFPSWFQQIDNSTIKNKNEHSLKYPISDHTTMSILGILLCEKQSKRKSLLNDLEQLGVNS